MAGMPVVRCLPNPSQVADGVLALMTQSAEGLSAAARAGTMEFIWAGGCGTWSELVGNLPLV